MSTRCLLLVVQVKNIAETFDDTLAIKTVISELSFFSWRHAKATQVFDGHCDGYHAVQGAPQHWKQIVRADIQHQQGERLILDPNNLRPSLEF